MLRGSARSTLSRRSGATLVIELQAAEVVSVTADGDRVVLAWSWSSNGPAGRVRSGLG